MSSQFLDNLSLSTLIAPVSADEFRSRYWEQMPMIVHRNDPNYYGDLFTLHDFDDAISRTPNYVKVADATSKKNESLGSTTAPQLELILNSMRDGGTLILDGMHRYNHNLATLCRLLGPEFGQRFQTNLYLTPPNGKGFTPHWDNHDVFILQVHGSKEWKIEKARRAMPTRMQRIGAEGRELRGDVYSLTLNQGDLIYIPRGFVHAAECGAVPSLHITLGVTALFWESLLYDVIRTGVEEDEKLRATLPMEFMKGDNKEIVPQIKSIFSGLATDAFLNKVVDAYRARAIQTFPLEVSGLVENYFAPRKVELDDHFSHRRGMVFNTHAGADTVRLVFGGRNIDFLGIFREALEFAMNKPAFKVRDLPGELEDVEKVVFVERMMQEGILVRAPN